MIPAVACEGVTVMHGRVTAVNGFNLSVAAGETIALLGPSGSGKTSLLHAIAGFLPLTAGTIEIEGELVAGNATDVPPDRRRIGFVFQNYALWPHLDAMATVAYPFRRQGMSRKESELAAQDLLKKVGIGELSDRRPAELSGGQQQRVGLARALARQGAVFLFDEPTAHLDAVLRAVIQEEIADRLRETGAGAIYASHDATEALALADRVGLLREGKLIQLGTPVDVYERPVDVWAAQLTGPLSILKGFAKGSGSGDVDLQLGERTVSVRAEGNLDADRWLVRPDWFRINESNLPAVVHQVWYRGTHTDYRLETSMGRMDVRVPGVGDKRSGDRVRFTIDRVYGLPA